MEYGDNISRQQAIDALRTCYDTETVTMDNGDEYINYNDAVGEIEQLPPVTPKQPEQDWIPVSEGMPEEREWIGTKRFGTTISDEVYVTFETPKGERFCKHIRFQNGKLNSADQHTIDTYFKGSKPIAWIPLPKPWEGDAE